MWTNRLDLATLPAQRALAGPGSFPNPDFLEVGYSPRAFKGRAQSLTEQRSMFTLWAALPGPLILSADLRKSSWNTVRKPTAFFICAVSTSTYKRSIYQDRLGTAT
jgi:hypothetical protein